MACVGGRRQGSTLSWWGGALMAAAVAATAAAQSCPASTCLRSGAGTNGCALTDHKNFECEATHWAKHITTFPNKWYSLNNVTALPAMPGVEYIKTRLPCCSHCAWSLGYPIAIPEYIAISPGQDTCVARTGAGQMSQCYMDCSKWAGDYAVLDKNNDGKLNRTEFTRYISDYFVAPPQLYQLYTGGGVVYSRENSRLDPDIIFLQADMDDDQFVSANEWNIFRHYVAAFLVSNSGPTMAPADGRPLADGPYGGFFIDQSLTDVWATMKINMMLDYYMGRTGFLSSSVREPVPYERLKIMQELDLDGSLRIGLDEHYFKHFADKDGDGFLSKSEYYGSNYRKTCEPLSSNGGLAGDCGGATFEGVRSDKKDGEDVLMNFKIHDIDNDGKISFLERKFVQADTDHSQSLSAEEWRFGDFPLGYGPFEGHARCTNSETCSIDREEYSYYMAFHECASQGVLAYNKPLSEYPWAESCKLVVQIEDHRPFTHVEKFTTAAEKLAWENRGFLCWDANSYEADNLCVSGYAMHEFDEIARRLSWSYVPKLLRLTAAQRRQAAASGASAAVTQLPPPKIAGNGATQAVFEMGLFAVYQMPWRPPQYAPGDFRCSDSLWQNDGLVIVKRTALKEINVELAIVEMLITPTFVNFVVFIYLIVIVLGHIFWLIERGENPLFAEEYCEGIIDGMWYAIVTMSTVGYGDKVPVTGVGKMTTILWMFFGIISFGVFSGNVSSQIDLASAENNIFAPEDLAGFQVGIYSQLHEPLVKNVDLDKYFGFTATTCKDMPECFKSLLDGAMPAIIAPHSDVLVHFNKTSLNNVQCGNPTSVSGASFTTDNTATFTGNTVKVCSYSRSVYAAGYLADAISATQQHLINDGTSEKLASEFLSQDQPKLAAEGCEPPSRFKIPLIAATVVILFFYFVLINLMRRYRKRQVQKMVLAHLQKAVGQHKTTTLTPDECAAKYGAKWLGKARANIAKKNDARIKALEELGAHDFLVHIVKRIRHMSMQQTSVIRDVIHSVFVTRERVSRFVTVISILGAVICFVLIVLTITLLVLWSKIVRLTNI